MRPLERSSLSCVFTFPPFSLPHIKIKLASVKRPRGHFEALDVEYIDSVAFYLELLSRNCSN